MKMPEKDPNVWLIVWAYIQQNYNAITGFVMAFFMSMLRAWFLQQKSSYRQRILDGAICGALTLSCMSLLNHFGLHENLSTFIGGMIGFIGAEKIREFLFKFITKKVSKDE
ncbi:phage holin, lambda family [Gallibacterium anatis]|uniref:phage holin, lambda family n=2 Tax=Gallibacterium anatis TaxID=750 RepID=UPI0005312870|nr:phage holin, lambda family [Gallibacterium anatis]KGQ40667.1 permease [Gallibacterium anatis IPDH697-78]MDK9560967.1 phage holin, lambda family [Gallibacterium anatis]